MRPQVDDHVADVDDRRRLGCTASPGHRTHSRHELIDVERFGDVVVSTCVEGADLLDGVQSPRQDQNGDH